MTKDTMIGFCTMIILVQFSSLANSLKEKDKILQDLGFGAVSQFDKLEVTFGSSSKVDFGNSLALSSVKTKPSVKIPDVERAKFLTLAMVDPDAPNRKNPSAKVGKQNRNGPSILGCN